MPNLPTETPVARPEQATVPQPVATTEQQRPGQADRNHLLDQFAGLINNNPDAAVQSLANASLQSSESTTSEAPKKPSQQTSSETARNNERPIPEGAVVDMVKGPDGKWTARELNDPNFFYYPEPEKPKTDSSQPNTSTDSSNSQEPKGVPLGGWEQWRAKEANWANFQQHTTQRPGTRTQFHTRKPSNWEATSNFDKPGNLRQPEHRSAKALWEKAKQSQLAEEQREFQKQQAELQKLQEDGTRLAKLVYTTEGQQQIAEVRAKLTQIVETIAGKPRREAMPSGFERSSAAFEETEQKNQRLMQAWRQRNETRVEQLLRGDNMNNLEIGAYLTSTLGRETSYADSVKEKALLPQFDRQRFEIGRALLYQSSDTLPVGRRYLLAGAARLKFYGISTTQAQENFARGWDGIKNGLQAEKDQAVTVESQTDNPEVRMMTDRLSSVEHTGTALNTLLHEQVTFSRWGEELANFVRFRGRIRDRLFLGTNHENTEAEIRIVNSYIQNIIDQGITTAYIEQGGLTAKDNLNRWLVENGYINDHIEGELSYLAENLSKRSINVVNMDLARNPSALPVALERYGLQRVARALNWNLDIYASGFKSPLDRNKISEIITRLVTEAGGQTTQEEITTLIHGRDMTNNDHYTDTEREEYMASVIQGEKVAVAAHSGHTVALLDRINGNQPIEDVKIFIDSEKIEKVIAENGIQKTVIK